MRTPEVHPEDLFDKADRGTLSPTEAEHLELHLQACEACRFERAARRDFSAMHAAAPVDARLHLLVDRALKSTQYAAPVENSAPAHARRVGTNRRLSALAAAAVVLAATMAAAQSEAVRHVFQLARAKVEALLGVTPAVEHARREVVERVEEPNVVAPVPLAVVQPTANVVQRAPVIQRVAPEKANVQAHVPSGARTVASNASRTKDVATPEPVPVLPTPEPVQPVLREEKLSPASAPRAESGPSGARPQALARPAEMLAQATALRRQGDASGAIAAYHALQRSWPESTEAKVSSAVLGRLWLDHGDAIAALSEFNEYIASRDVSLREEALAGRALAFKMLGQRHEEDMAWGVLLLEFPNSSYAGVARERTTQAPP